MQLKINGISKSYNSRKALNNLSFTLDSGEITALIGSNGAGKTTVIKCLSKLISIDTGDISLNNINISIINNKDYPITYIPDTPIYFEQLTVLENLQFICSAYKTDTNQINILAKRLELEEYLDLLPSELSKGNKQKIMIVGGLLRNFDILIADEPFSGLDPVQIKVLKDIFLEQKDRGKMILVSIHSLDLAQTFCDKYVIIKKGELLIQANKDELLNMVSSQEDKEVTSVENAYLKLLEKEGTNNE